MSFKYRNLNLKLGRETNETNLDAIPRKTTRDEFNSRTFPYGYDLWNAWEAGFFQSNGVPASFILQLAYAADSPALVESKSLKLYLNHLRSQTFPSTSAYLKKIKSDLEACVQAPVQLSPIYDGAFMNQVQLPGICLEQEVRHLVIPNQPLAADISWEPGKKDFIAHTLSFQSNCPVTGQPDYANVLIELRGDKYPRQKDLLAYLMAFKDVQEFHEICCETIFSDLLVFGEPGDLTVSCFFTRRGGLDINPVRSTMPVQPLWGNLYWRQ